MYVCLPLVVCFGFVVEGFFVFCLFGQDPIDNSLVVFGGAWSCIFALTWQDDLLAEIRLLLHWILPGKWRRKKDEMLEVETGVSWTEKNNHCFLQGRNEKPILAKPKFLCVSVFVNNNPVTYSILRSGNWDSEWFGDKSSNLTQSVWCKNCALSNPPHGSLLREGRCFSLVCLLLPPTPTPSIS